MEEHLYKPTPSARNCKAKKMALGILRSTPSPSNFEKVLFTPVRTTICNEYVCFKRQSWVWLNL